jgi:2-polyprenyl-6-methoxyphenol hydroxylase-like FAD-dependent oxidoreductase
MEKQSQDGLVAKDAKESILISGASFAGLATAWWMHRLGYRVTVVDVAPGLRKGGTPVDIRESVVDVVRRMGLLENIAAESLPPRPTQFIGTDGRPLMQEAPQEDTEDREPEWEIERDALLDMLFDRVKDDVEFLFNDSISRVEETKEAVQVTFASGQQSSFALLFGCDGTHSNVRKMCFGEESLFLLFMRNYFSLTIVDKLLIPENTAQMFSLPGKTVMVNAYHDKTDIAFSFFCAKEVWYDRRDRERQKKMILEHLAGAGWRTDELLQQMKASDNFYFDKLCQVRMPAWTRGRVALVGDAGYCPSPAAGMGGSMALLGAAAVADAFQKHPGDFARAFEGYDKSLRPIVEEIQTNAIEFGLKMFLPASDEEIDQRNAQLKLRYS